MKTLTIILFTIGAICLWFGIVKIGKDLPTGIVALAFAILFYTAGWTLCIISEIQEKK